jgi:hypothetical protein
MLTGRGAEGNEHGQVKDGQVKNGQVKDGQVDVTFNSSSTLRIP